MKRAEILAQARDARIDEILLYDVNIENFRAAIAEIDKTKYEDQLAAEMTAHRAQLAELLRTSRIEREKAALILRALEEQIAKYPPDAA